MKSRPIIDEYPLRIGSAADFAQIRSALGAARFDEETICRTLRIKAMSDISSVNLNVVDFGGVSDQLPILLGLFIGDGAVPRTSLERVLDRPVLDAMLALGLLGTDEIDGNRCYARVLLYPVAGFWIASSRSTNPDGSPFVAPPDMVFPAIFGGTLRFLELLPQSRAESALDLCAGSGIGAFVLSRKSSRAVASDVTERATHFARFNRALNGLANVDIVCGDLYSAVSGQTFDRIVAHPPYVPSVDIAAIWRDGGATGELLVRRIMEQLPAHLRPEGLSCTVTLGMDTAEGRFEDRVRRWLGERAEEFDIIFAAADERTPDAVLRSLSEREPRPTAAELAQLKQILAEATAVAMPWGALFIRRHSATGNRPGWTLRKKLSGATDGRDLEQAFVLHDRLSDPRFAERLARSRPQLSPWLQVNVTHVVSEGSLRPAEYIFATDRPFIARGVVDGWMVPLIARLDGASTPVEVHGKAKLDGELPDGFELSDFNAMLTRMIERGFLLLPENGD